MILFFFLGVFHKKVAACSVSAIHVASTSGTNDRPERDKECRGKNDRGPIQEAKNACMDSNHKNLLKARQ